jgi:hypothetical protein
MFSTRLYLKEFANIHFLTYGNPILRGYRKNAGDNYPICYSEEMFELDCSDTE